MSLSMSFRTTEWKHLDNQTSSHYPLTWSDIIQHYICHSCYLLFYVTGQTFKMLVIQLTILLQTGFPYNWNRGGGGGKGRWRHDFGTKYGKHWMAKWMEMKRQWQLTGKRGISNHYSWSLTIIVVRSFPDAAQTVSFADIESFMHMHHCSILLTLPRNSLSTNTVLAASCWESLCVCW